tara:strand:+ start:5343 stop:6029 length:687 start_codon:yes stop_codon:yes gene_type:complete
MSFDSLPHNIASFRLFMEHSFKSVLDIGPGKNNLFIPIMKKKGISVDTVDLHDGATFRGDYNKLNIDKKYDAIICYNCLEHQNNSNLFLEKLHENLKIGGYLTLSVPPWKHRIVDGHVSCWNAGLLLYNLVLAKWDCSSIKIQTFSDGVVPLPQINIMLQKTEKIKLPHLSNDRGDLYQLKDYFPKDVAAQIENNAKRCKNPFSNLNEMKSNFEGRIKKCNWFVGFEK